MLSPVSDSIPDTLMDEDALVIETSDSELCLLEDTTQSSQTTQPQPSTSTTITTTVTTESKPPSTITNIRQLKQLFSEPITFVQEVAPPPIPLSQLVPDLDQSVSNVVPPQQPIKQMKHVVTQQTTTYEVITAEEQTQLQAATPMDLSCPDQANQPDQVTYDRQDAHADLNLHDIDVDAENSPRRQDSDNDVPDDTPDPRTTDSDQSENDAPRQLRRPRSMSAPDRSSKFGLVSGSRDARSQNRQYHRLLQKPYIWSFYSKDVLVKDREEQNGYSAPFAPLADEAVLNSPMYSDGVARCLVHDRGYMCPFCTENADQAYNYAGIRLRKYYHSSQDLCTHVYVYHYPFSMQYICSLCPKTKPSKFPTSKAFVDHMNSHSKDRDSRIKHEADKFLNHLAMNQSQTLDQYLSRHQRQNTFYIPPAIPQGQLQVTILRRPVGPIKLGPFVMNSKIFSDNPINNYRDIEDLANQASSPGAPIGVYPTFHLLNIVREMTMTNQANRSARIRTFKIPKEFIKYPTPTQTQTNIPKRKRQPSDSDQPDHTRTKRQHGPITTSTPAPMHTQPPTTIPQEPVHLPPPQVTPTHRVTHPPPPPQVTPVTPQMQSATIQQQQQQPTNLSLQTTTTPLTFAQVVAGHHRAKPPLSSINFPPLVPTTTDQAQTSTASTIDQAPVVLAPSVDPSYVENRFSRKQTLHEAAESAKYERVLQQQLRDEGYAMAPAPQANEDWDDEIVRDPQPQHMIETARRLPKDYRRLGIKPRKPEFLDVEPLQPPQRSQRQVSATITRPDQAEPQAPLPIKVEHHVPIKTMTPLTSYQPPQPTTILPTVTQTVTVSQPLQVATNLVDQANTAHLPKPNIPMAPAPDHASYDQVTYQQSTNTAAVKLWDVPQDRRPLDPKFVLLPEQVLSDGLLPDPSLHSWDATLQQTCNPGDTGTNMPIIKAEVCSVKPDPVHMYWPDTHPSIPQSSTNNKLLDEFLEEHKKDVQNRTMPGLVPLPFETTDLMSSTRFQLGRVTSLRQNMDNSINTDAVTHRIPSVDLATQSTGHMVDAINQLGVLADYFVHDFPRYMEVIMRASESSGMKLIADHIQASKDTKDRRTRELERTVEDLTNQNQRHVSMIQQMQTERMQLAKCIKQHELRNQGRSTPMTQLESDYANIAAKLAHAEALVARLRHNSQDPQLVYKQFLSNLIHQVSPDQYKNALDYLNAIMAQRSGQSTSMSRR